MARVALNRTQLKQMIKAVRERHATDLVRGTKIQATTSAVRSGEARRKLEYLKDLKKGDE